MSCRCSFPSPVHTAPDGRRQWLAFVAQAALAWSWPMRGHAAAEGTTPSDATTPGHEWRPWPTRQPTPRLALNTLDGSPWRLADQRGQVVLLNFWASWCGPCQAEMPTLARLARREADRGLIVVTVNFKETIATVRRFVQAQHLALPVLLDTDGTAAQAWTPRIFPSTVLINRQGRPQGLMLGEFDWDGAEARALLHTALTGTTATSTPR